MGRKIIILWATTLLLGFLTVGWWIFSSQRMQAADQTEVNLVVPNSSPAVTAGVEMHATAPPAHKILETSEPTLPLDKSECLGVFIRSALPVEDNGDEKPRCFPGLNPDSPEVCTDPRPSGDEINPSQIWTNRVNGKRTVCEHGGYCYPMDAIKLNAACYVKGAVSRYDAEPTR